MNLDKLCGFETMCFRLKDRSYDFDSCGGGGGAVGGVVGGSSNAREIDLGKDFGAVVVKVNGATIEVSSDGVAKLQSAPANDTSSKAAHEIGDIESTGEHKGEIYGGLFPDGRPGWISEEPEPMTHYDAVELKGRALPTREEGKYIDTIKGKDALKDIFARHSDGSSSAGYFWLAEHNFDTARYQQFSDGSQLNYDLNRSFPLPVLCVRR